MLKITGWPRIRFLAEIFPDARFVHLVRDGRVVARSQVEQSWWTGADGPERWAWGPLPERYWRQWLGSRRTQVELGAIAWEMALDAVADCKRALDPSRLFEVRYEDLCREPRSVTEEMLAFLELGWTDEVEAKLRGKSIENRNDARGPIESDEWRDLGPIFKQLLALYDYT